MAKLFKILGFIILEFIVILNFTSLELPAPVVITLGISGATFLIGGILMGKRERKD